MIGNIITDKIIIKYLQKRGYFISKANYQYAYDSFVETFIQQQYRWLVQNLKPNTTAIDYGSQAGDSVFYMFYEGKGKIEEVLAYEPDDDFYNLLSKNLKLVNANNIIPFHAKAPEPFTIPKNKDNIIIKCDIEGAEHNVFTKDADLTGVYKIQLEYHGGTRDLPKIFESKGFKVKIDSPWVIDTKLGEVGWLYAWK